MGEGGRMVEFVKKEVLREKYAHLVPFGLDLAKGVSAHGY